MSSACAYNEFTDFEDSEYGLESRLMDSGYTEEDAATELSLRPKNLKEYIGQAKAKDNLSLEIKLPCGNENINPQSIVNSFCEQNELQIYVSYKRISLLVDDNTIFE